MKKKLPQGFKEFLIKGFSFGGLFILIQLITMGFVAKTTLPGNLKLFAMDDLAEAVFFVMVLFIGLNRDSILRIKSYSVLTKTRLFSFVSVVLGLVVYFFYKKFLLNNLVLVAEHIYFFTVIEYSLLFIVLFFLIVSVFGFKFCRDFFREHKFGIGYSFLGVISVYFLEREFQDLWVYLSSFVGHSVVYLLNFVGQSSIYYLKGLPVIVFNNFNVGVAKTCSGIDSILLFSGLYLGILAWDWKLLDKKKVFFMYFVGVVGAFAVNIFRIFLLILIGYYVSMEFAVHTFHTNASSILFIIYFAIFWKFLYKWMKK